MFRVLAQQLWPYVHSIVYWHSALRHSYSWGLMSCPASCKSHLIWASCIFSNPRHVLYIVHLRICAANFSLALYLILYLVSMLCTFPPFYYVLLIIVNIFRSCPLKWYPSGKNAFLILVMGSTPMYTTDWTLYLKLENSYSIFIGSSNQRFGKNLPHYFNFLIIVGILANVNGLLIHFLWNELENTILIHKLWSRSL